MPVENLPADVPQPPFHLANRGSRPNTARMRRFLKRLGIAASCYADMTGGQPLNAFAKANPTWTQRAWEVLALENLDALQNDTQSPDTDRRGGEITACATVGAGWPQDGG